MRGKEVTLQKLAVVVSARRLVSRDLRKFCNEIFALALNMEVIVIISMDYYSGFEFWKAAREVAREFERSVFVVVNEDESKSSAFVYLRGFQEAIKLGATQIIEMDFGGNHRVSKIPDFAEQLKTSDVVLSSRFLPGGKIINYPLQRRAVSYIGTLLSNVFLRPGKPFTDMTSGYEGFSVKFLEELFTLRSPEEWVSVTHPVGHLYQTEIRFYVRMLQDSGKIRISELPITYGREEKRGKALPFKYLWEALVAFIALVRYKSEFLQKIQK